MASLREAVTVYRDELRAGIAWIAFWREGRSWNSDYLYLEMDDTLTPEDRSRLQEIQHIDPAAVVLNGYYCNYLGEDMNLKELTFGVRLHYENSTNDITDFIEAHDNALPPEQIEEAREAAQVAELSSSERTEHNERQYRKNLHLKRRPRNTDSKNYFHCARSPAANDCPAIPAGVSRSGWIRRTD